MSLRIKIVVDKFVQELKEALDADIQDRIMKEREMQSYIEEREREVAEREAAWKAELSRREVLFSTTYSIRFFNFFHSDFLPNTSSAILFSGLNLIFSSWASLFCLFRLSILFLCCLI